MLIALITIVHIIVCLILIVVVLLQSGKGADLAGAFGGGSQTAFGPRGAATWASRVTTIAAVLFMITSISLAILQSRKTGGSGSVLDTVKTAPASEQKSAPPPVPAPVDQTPDSGKSDAAKPDASKKDSGTKAAPAPATSKPATPKK